MHFKKAANTTFLILTACFFASAIVVQLAIGAGFNFPQEMKAGIEKSELEGRSYAEFPKLSSKELKNGKAQAQFESYLSDRIPMRDNVLLANAALQRACIKAANFPFNFDAYPTFFEADTSAVPVDNLIIPNASKTSSKCAPIAEKLSKLLNRLAQEHPETRFVYDALSTSATSEFNPTYKYSTDGFNETWNQDHVLCNLTAENIFAFDDSIESFDELKTLWLTTEHHWTLKRALISYNRIAQNLGLTEYPYKNPILVKAKWYGARCRLGLDLEASSDFYDMPTDFSNIEWRNNKGDKISYGKRDAFLAGKNIYGNSPTYNVYDSYYGTEIVRAINNNTNSNRSCLVVCLSYAKALKGYIASNYKETVFIAPGKKNTEKPLSAYLDEGFDDVIIQLGRGNYLNIAERSPKFIG